jgi:prepilin-type N-terminal cleavage/methylation domain-containing protein
MALGMTNDEARMTKEIRSANDERRRNRHAFRHSDFVIDSSFGFRVSSFGRSGMTLVEILIAMGILSIGMVSICSLFPLCIRNISTAVNRTVATSVAQSAITSMKDFNCLDLTRMPRDSDYTLNPTPPPTYVLSPTFIVDDHFARIQRTAGATPTFSYLAGGGSINDAIYEFSRSTGANIPRGCGGSAVGSTTPSATEPSFQIPQGRDGSGNAIDCVVLPPALRGGDSTHPTCVAYTGDTAYGWTATLYPGSGSIGSPTEQLTVQVAVWRGCQLVSGLNAPSKVLSGGFTNREVPPASGKWIGLVTLDTNTVDPSFFTKVHLGDYVRHKDFGIWYEIADMDKSASPPVIRLMHPFSHPSFDQNNQVLSGELEVASRFHLVALYRDAL